MCMNFRIVQYTTEQEVRDYLRWRQVDSELGPSLVQEIHNG